MRGPVIGVAIAEEVQHHLFVIADAARDLVTPFGELACDEVGGAVLGKSQLGVLVQMAANGNQLLLIGQELGDTGEARLSRSGRCHSRTMLLALAMRV